jgi:hypothetical protein
MQCSLLTKCPLSMCRFVEGNHLTGCVPESLINNTSIKFTYTPTGLFTGPSPTQCTKPLATPPVMSPVPSESKSSTTAAAIIIGSVVGGLGLIILIGVIICLWCCRQRLWQYSNSLSSRQLLKADPEAGMKLQFSIRPWCRFFLRAMPMDESLI